MPVPLTPPAELMGYIKKTRRSLSGSFVFFVCIPYRDDRRLEGRCSRAAVACGRRLCTISSERQLLLSLWVEAVDLLLRVLKPELLWVELVAQPPLQFLGPCRIRMLYGLA